MQGRGIVVVVVVVGIIVAIGAVVGNGGSHRHGGGAIRFLPEIMMIAIRHFFLRPGRFQYARNRGWNPILDPGLRLQYDHVE